ncbi:helix-turn-helix domain-containing protein [Anaerosporobacter faecicola]|uniref:helix-turn-helix domain-containing protein n=1 Tax=Anaerosporobacter faecicola TaxID=2718714 RepID=UPI00143A96E3|nr:helix-turn-helix domain-containing protein [Anaerosporobacter faecicola]
MVIDRKKIIELREKNGYTQFKLASIANISVVTLNKIETSENAKPFPSTVQKIAIALGVSIQDLQIQTEDISSNVNKQIDNAIKNRMEMIQEIMEIDSFMFSYVNKQMEIFKRDLGNVFGISSAMLLEAAFFSGVSWSRVGNTTYQSNYPKVLGDLLALHNIEIGIKLENVKISTMDEINQYVSVSGIYGICTADGELIRIGQTKDIAKRIKEHIEELSKENYPTMKKYISKTQKFGKDYYFKILGFLPNIGRKMTALQADTWLYYAETRLIIVNKTYLKGNRGKKAAVFTGDPYIPFKVQDEMIKYYYGDIV